MKITKETIVRLIFLILAVVNVLLEMFNKPLIPIESEAFRQGIDALLLIIATGWGYWKNNSFSHTVRYAMIAWQKCVVLIKLFTAFWTHISSLSQMYICALA